MPGQFDEWVQGELFSDAPVPEGQLEFDFETPESLGDTPSHVADYDFVDAFDDNQDPTSTSNPERPRTLVAGYNLRTRTMTVMFRDGTVWDYRDVPPLLWANFKRAFSKGWFLYNSGLDRWHDMGPSNMANLSDEQRENWAIRARTAQVRAEGLAPGQSATNAARYRREDAAIKRKGLLSHDGSRISNPYLERDKKRWGIPPNVVINPMGGRSRRKFK